MKTKGIKSIAFVCLAAVLLITAVSGLVFRLNKFCIEFSIPSGETDTVEYGTEYSLPEVKAYLKGKIFYKSGKEIETEQVGTADMSALGEYKIVWSASGAGTENSAVRTVKVVDTTAPVITLAPSKKEVIYSDEKYEEAGYSATDIKDGEFTGQVTVAMPDMTALGEKEIVYTVSDSSGNTATAVRKITVKARPKPITVTTVPSVNAAAAGGSVIYLTFDDGPSAYTPKLLDILAKYNVKATFFVTGAGNRSLIAREANEGHTVAIHTLSHNYSQIYSSDEAYFADLNAMNEIIKEQTGSYTNLLRFPGGSSNTVSKKYNAGIMTRLSSALEAQGYKYFDWNVASGDTGGAKTADKVYLNVINGVRGKQHSVVLQHDIKSYSVDAVERIIVWGLNNGYTFAPLTNESPTVHQHINN